MLHRACPGPAMASRSCQASTNEPCKRRYFAVQRRPGPLKASKAIESDLEQGLQQLPILVWTWVRTLRLPDARQLWPVHMNCREAEGSEIVCLGLPVATALLGIGPRDPQHKHWGSRRAAAPSPCCSLFVSCPAGFLPCSPNAHVLQVPLML